MDENHPTPHVDEHHPSVAPEVRRDELIDGRVIQALPAKAAHGMSNFDLDCLVGAHLAKGYRGANDLMTRFEPESDFATDTAVLKDGVDPSTGHRYLESIAFEVVSQQNESVVEEKVPRILRRGVRRVFGVFLKAGEVREWIKMGGGGYWKTLVGDARIEDDCLKVPLPVSSILDVALRDDTVAAALIAKDNPVITEHMAQVKAEAKAEAVVMILEQRGLEPSDTLRLRILACTDLATLESWMKRAFVVEDADDLTD